MSGINAGDELMVPFFVESQYKNIRFHDLVFPEKAKPLKTQNAEVLGLAARVLVGELLEAQRAGKLPVTEADTEWLAELARACRLGNSVSGGVSFDALSDALNFWIRAYCGNWVERRIVDGSDTVLALLTENQADTEYAKVLQQRLAEEQRRLSIVRKRITVLRDRIDVLAAKYATGAKAGESDRQLKVYRDEIAVATAQKEMLKKNYFARIAQIESVAGTSRADSIRGAAALRLLQLQLREECSLLDVMETAAQLRPVQLEARYGHLWR